MADIVKAQYMPEVREDGEVVKPYPKIVHFETSADLVLYNNTSSGLVAQTEQAAIDELALKANTNSTSINALIDQQLLDAPIGDILRKHTKQALGYSYVSVPNNASGGVECIIKGFTLKNELNYNRDTWAEWTKPSGIVGDATGLEWTANGSTSLAAYIITAFKQSTKYGILYNVVSNAFTGGFGFDAGVFNYATLSKTVGNNKIITTSNASITVNRCSLYNQNAAETAGSKIKLRDIRIFELPAGSTIESDFTNLTADELAKKYPYVKGDAVKHTGAVRVKSVGKNLFDGKIELGSISTSTGANTSSTVGSRSILYNRIKPSASGYLSGTIRISGDPTAILFYDINKAFISATEALGVGGAFSSPSNAYYYKIKYGSPTDLSSAIQVEYGSTATPYEPYTESIVYLPAIGKSVPSASDQINVLWDGKSDGLKATQTQKVSNLYTFVSTDLASLDTTTFTNVDVVKTVAFPLAKVGTSAADGQTRLYDKNGFEMIEVSATDRDLVSSVGKYYWASDSKAWIIVGKGSYADIASARTLLGTPSIIYQLATPITSNLQLRGQLRAYPNGTVYTKPCLSGYFKGAASTVITDSAIPIKAIRSVVRIDTVNGKNVETDVTTAASIGTSNTSVNLSAFDADKWYFYDCEYDTQYSTTPEIVANCEVDGGIVTHDYGAAAVAKTLTANESKAQYFKLTNAGGAAQLIFVPEDGVIKVIDNQSGQTITVKTSTSTGITVATGKKATVLYIGTDYIKISEV